MNRRGRPRLAVFPKAYMDSLCVTGSLSLAEWIAMAATLEVEGLEFYGGFLELKQGASWPVFRNLAREHGLEIPMLCCSPDFCHPDAGFRWAEVDKQMRWIDMTAALGGRYCRVLSGQGRPGIGVERGLDYVAEAVHECAAYAAKSGITLVLENHYKDNYWRYPEFARSLEVFLALLARINAPNFGVNYDPSNAIMAGEDPLHWLHAVSDRVVTMHASDRYLTTGTLDDLAREEIGEGYAARLAHGEIGQGLNDYDAILSELATAGFGGWISIEDGVDGLDQLHRSAAFLNKKIRAHFPAGPLQ